MSDSNSMLQSGYYHQPPPGSLHHHQSKTRKSQLTQQQRNSKRQRATPEQFAVLQAEFYACNTPTATKRHEISKRIDMTERSVQIWFQNRRAKSKQAPKKHGIPEYEEKQCPGSNSIDRFHTSRNIPFQFRQHDQLHIPRRLMVSQDYVPQPPQDSVNLPLTSFTIGTWSRTSAHASPSRELTACYLPATTTLMYVIFADDDNMGFRLDIPFHAVHSLELSRDSKNPDLGIVELCMTQSGQILFQILAPGHSEWVITSDFSENTQASQINLHKLTGPYDKLQQSLARVAAFEPNKINIGGPHVPYFTRNSILEEVPDRTLTQSTPAFFPTDDSLDDTFCDSHTSLVSPFSDGSQTHFDCSYTDYDLFRPGHKPEMSWSTVSSGLLTSGSAETMATSPDNWIEEETKKGYEFCDHSVRAVKQEEDEGAIFDYDGGLWMNGSFDDFNCAVDTNQLISQLDLSEYSHDVLFESSN